VSVDYGQILSLAAPETVVVVAALAVLAADLLFLRELSLSFRRIIGGLIACAGCVGAAAWMLALPQHANLFSGMLVVDPLTQLVKVSLLALAVLTILISMEASFTTHIGEFLALVLLATVGMMFLVSAEDILMIFIALELTSLSLYILTAFNKRNIKSAEAALKYFLFGGMAAAFTLFGLSLLYGLSGETNLGRIAAALKGAKLDPLLIVAIVMTVIGFGFKVAAAPFHLWAPDAYEGAPGPSAAFIASGSKVASFFIAAKVMMVGFNGVEVEGSAGWRGGVAGWVPVVATGAVLSVVLGNLAAIVQSSVRRLLAYSAIAHAGYTLVGLLSHTGQGLASVVYYAITYGLTALGAFGVVTVVQEKTGGDKLSDFAGLSRREPVLAFCMLIFMLSLAGIPPLAGFFGKFYLFTAALNSDGGNLSLLWLVIAAIAFSAVSLYYYLQVLKQIYVAPVPAEVPKSQSSILSQIVIGLIAAGVLLFGCIPDLLVGSILAAVKAAGF
jgi:NADH-quinone oxidoreductase subunit N